MNSQERREATFSCACFSHRIIATQWNDDDHEVSLAIWSPGWDSDRRVPLRARLRWAWRALRRGSPYEDQVILSESDARRFARFLLNVPDGYIITSHSWTSTNSSTVDSSGPRRTE